MHTESGVKLPDEKITIRQFIMNSLSVVNAILTSRYISSVSGCMI